MWTGWCGNRGLSARSSSRTSCTHTQTHRHTWFHKMASGKSPQTVVRGLNASSNLLSCLFLEGEFMGFPASSDGKESTCNAGNPGSIPGLGCSPGERIDYTLQHSGASLVAQMIKNPSSVQKTWVQFLCWEDPLKEDMATHSSILAWRIDRGAWRATDHGITKSWTKLSD